MTQLHRLIAELFPPRDRASLLLMLHAAARVDVVQRDLAEYMLAALDLCQKMQLTSRGGLGYAHIPAHVPALFEALGAPPDLYHRLGVATPRRLLCWDRADGITSAAP